jgi:UDP-glucose 4-epimerase
MHKTIFITGGAGYIGSHTAYALAQQHNRVIILDAFMHNQIFNPPWATIIKGNLSNNSLLKKIFTDYAIDAVMHFAANIEVGESVKSPLQFYENNVCNTITLLQTMKEYNVNKFIFSSSCAVYGTPQQLPLTESHPINPISPYGKTKAIIDSLLYDCATAYGLQFVSLRYFNAAGALPAEGLGEQHKPETHLIPLLLRAAIQEKPFTMFGTDFPTSDGTAVRDYVHVLDIADAHCQALTYLNAGNASDIFNLGTGHGFSVQQMIAATEQVVGKKIIIKKADRRAGDPHTLIADAGKAKKILAWEPKYSDLYSMIRFAYEFEMRSTSSERHTSQVRRII